MSILVGPTTIRAVQGDITRLEVDVVVNAANEYLSHGGGVAAAISRAGGPIVQEESSRWVAEHGPVGRGQAAVTSAGSLPASHVVHVVGPVYRGTADDEPDLRAAVRAALLAADATGGRSVAFPAISTGVFGYPTPAAARVIVDQTVDWLTYSDTGVTEVVLVGFDDRTAEAFRDALSSASPGG